MQFSFHRLFGNRHRLGLLAETVIEGLTTCNISGYIKHKSIQIYLEKMIWNNVIDFPVSSSIGVYKPTNTAED